MDYLKNKQTSFPLPWSPFTITNITPKFRCMKVLSKNKNLISDHFQKGHKFFVPKLVTAPSRAEHALWLFGSGIFILQEDRKGE